MATITMAMEIDCPNLQGETREEHMKRGWCTYSCADGRWFVCPVHKERLGYSSGYCKSCRAYWKIPR